MMDFHLSLSNTLINRKSCRKFNPERRISETQIDLLRWAGERAPHASGGPRREIYFSTRSLNREALYEACMNQQYVRDCSAVVIICGKDTDKKLRQGDPKYVFDCAAACMCIDLMAVSLGMATCWIGNFIPEQIEPIDANSSRPTIILLVGYRK